MAKRNNDGDVVANRISLLEAKGKKLLASLYGSRPDWDTGDSAATPQEEDNHDLKQSYAYDRVGLGGILPKDVEDGSFIRRMPTSDDKLLQQLIGKKKAKAHMQAKQEAARTNATAKARQISKPTVKKDASDDEEEGRAATFKSKRQQKKEKKLSKVDDSDDEDEETRAKRLAAGAKSSEDQEKKELVADSQVDERPPQKEEEGEDETVEPALKKAKTKPKSFLDEILAERSKKKNKKNRA